MTWPLNVAVLLGLACATFAVDCSQAASPVSMTATTPFTQSKVTDGNGAISYRVGGVFAAVGTNPSRLSLTAICLPAGGPLALLIVRTNAPPELKSGAATVIAHVDSQGLSTMASERTAGNGLASYELKAGPTIEALVSAMTSGQQLLVELDEFSAALPLSGFAGEMKDLTTACPHH